MSTVAQQQTAWIPATVGMRILAINYDAFIRLVRLGHIGRKSLPGMRTLYNQKDIEGLLTKCIEPAKKQERRQQQTKTARPGRSLKRAVSAR